MESTSQQLNGCPIRNIQSTVEPVLGLVWVTTRPGRLQSLARNVSNYKVPGVSDHLTDATSDRVVSFNQR